MKMVRQQRALVFMVSCACLLAATLAASRRLTDRKAFVDPGLQEATIRENRAPHVQLPEATQKAVSPDAVGPISHHVIAGGGGTSIGGSLKVEGTAGETSASTITSGGTPTYKREI